MLTATKEMLADRIFLGKAFRIALPVAMQGMLNTIVNLVDTMMIGALGSTAIAAVGLANKVFFVFSLLIFGINSGSGILAAQYWGNQDVKNIRKVLGLALLLGFNGTLLFAVPAVARPELVMRIFTPNPETIRVGASYLVIVAVSYPFTAFTNTYVAMLRAVGQVKLPVLTSCMAIVINIVLNFLLIFPARTVALGGNHTVFIWGAGMGVAGAALATLTARVMETLVLLLVVYWKKFPIACSPKAMIGYYQLPLEEAIQLYAGLDCEDKRLGVTKDGIAAVDLAIHWDGREWLSEDRLRMDEFKDDPVVAEAAAHLRQVLDESPAVGRVTFASGERWNYTDPQKYLQTVREELPCHATTGFRCETLTDDPEVRKAVDDMFCDLYGEENPRQIEDYGGTGMTMGGIT